MDEKIEKIIADLESIKGELASTLDHNYRGERRSAIKNLDGAISDLRWVEVSKQVREWTRTS
jgi:hypothetical protein